MAAPLISVIIPTYNRGETLPRAVSSVLGQVGAAYELIVVDDGGSDDAAALLEPWRGRLKLIALSRNMGVSAARNAGIREARGDYIALLDSDDEYLPGKLKAQLAYMEEKGQFLYSQCQERWIRGGRRVNPRKKHLKREGDIFIPSLSLSLISPSAFIARREFFDRVGLFDETLPACEDYDLWLRALEKYPVGLLDRELVIRYSGRADQLSAGHSLDKYRLQALAKVLGNPALSPERRAEAEKVLERKKKIYEGGSRKRGLAP